MTLPSERLEQEFQQELYYMPPQSKAAARPPSGSLVPDLMMQMHHPKSPGFYVHQARGSTEETMGFSAGEVPIPETPRGDSGCPHENTTRRGSNAYRHADLQGLWTGDAQGEEVTSDQGHQHEAD